MTAHTSDPLLRCPQVAQETGLSRATIYRLIRVGNFPRPLRISPNCVAWPQSQIAAWKASRPFNTE